ncbi:cytochrome P460 family protein [Bradyrhizobium sp. WSM 1704]|uniref:cytochrome P460 family protein n=1 Tax=Bradyrhizobium semiaridum TaxID=2821404 RepID=UPI001CE355D9|nr:cytochrome P460 family protein [Bradyrhizobium semiaridum]MCA6123711.1 cytochrome P460 family protein [Bradyrhizobium semiaridum]
MRQDLKWAAAAIAAACISAAVPFAVGHADDASPASPIFGVKIPSGYRDWKLIAVGEETGLDELRSVLGNATAVKAYQDSKTPFPDGTVLVKLAWKRKPVAGLDGAFITGQATTVQVMVKDSVRYAATGGWGFGRFVDGEPVDAAQHETCFACHEAHAKDQDFVFTHYAR